jgi:hypothetical protein
MIRAFSALRRLLPFRRLAVFCPVRFPEGLEVKYVAFPYGVRNSSAIDVIDYHESLRVVRCGIDSQSIVSNPERFPVIGKSLDASGHVHAGLIGHAVVGRFNPNALTYSAANPEMNEYQCQKRGPRRFHTYSLYEDEAGRLFHQQFYPLDSCFGKRTCTRQEAKSAPALLLTNTGPLMCFLRDKVRFGNIYSRPLW